MILKFEISGFASIKDKIVLDFNAIQNQRLKNTRYEYNYFLDKRVSKNIVLFGNNATGKTNILKSMSILFEIIFNGLNISQIQNLINNNSNFISYSIKVINKNNQIYTYNLSFDKEKVIYESLQKNDDYIYKFKDNKLTFSSYKQHENIFSVVSRDTILNKLRDNNIRNIVDFKRTLNQYTYSDTINLSEILDKYNEIIPFSKNVKDILIDNKDLVLDILSMLDVSISDFSFIDLKDDRFSLIIIRDTQEIVFEKESTGIKKIIELIPYIIVSINNGGTILIDELDSSISTRSLIYILNGVINSSINTKAQFIISSHNPLIFDIDILSPAQIYIVERENNSTTTKSLKEYDLRNDKKKAYISYLRGDYD